MPLFKNICFTYLNAALTFVTTVRNVKKMLKLYPAAKLKVGFKFSVIATSSSISHTGLGIGNDDIMTSLSALKQIIVRKIHHTSCTPTKLHHNK